MMAIYFIAQFTLYKFFYFFTAGTFIFIIFLSIYSDDGKKIIQIIVKSKLLLILFLWFCLSALWSSVPLVTLFEAMSLGIFFIVYFIFCYTWLSCSTKDVCKLYTLLVLIMIIINIVVLLQFGTMRPESARLANFLQQNNTLISGLTGRAVKVIIGSYSNTMVGILGPLLSFVIYSVYFEKKRNKLLSVIIMIFTLLSLALAESRAAYAIILLSFFAAGLFYSKNIIVQLKRLVFGIFILSVVILGLYSIPVTKSYVSVVMHRFQVPDVTVDKGSDNKIYSLFSSRLDIYDKGIKVIKDHPFLGLGMGAFKHEMEHQDGKKQHVMHNVFLNLWTGGGIIPVLIFLFVCIKAMRSLWQCYKKLLPYDKKEAYWYLCNFIILSVLLIHAQIRPQLTNIFLYFPLAIAQMSDFSVSRSGSK